MTTLRGIYRVVHFSRTQRQLSSAISLSLHSVRAVRIQVHKYSESMLYTIFGGLLVHFTILGPTLSCFIVTVETAHGMCSRCVCLIGFVEYKPRKEY